MFASEGEIKKLDRDAVEASADVEIYENKAHVDAAIGSEMMRSGVGGLQIG